MSAEQQHGRHRDDDDGVADAIRELAQVLRDGLDWRHDLKEMERRLIAAIESAHARDTQVAKATADLEASTSELDLSVKANQPQP